MHFVAYAMVGSLKYNKSCLNWQCLNLFKKSYLYLHYQFNRIVSFKQINTKKRKVILYSFDRDFLNSIKLYKLTVMCI